MDQNTPRRPVVADRFYPGDPGVLREQVAGYMRSAGERSQQPTLLAMAPHAGYVYSGLVAGTTLALANLADTILLLGPNHTGQGAPLSLWSGGDWAVPGGSVAVDRKLVARLAEKEPRLTPDMGAHLGEHSLEVMLPFLAADNPGVRIVPLAVAERNPNTLISVGKAVAEVLAEWPEPVSLVVSSDMSHYVSDKEARRLDRLALDAIEALDPARLYEVVRSNGITMCGVLPMVLALTASLALGAKTARVATYATSGEVSGDYDRVVGYAGVLVE